MRAISTSTDQMPSRSMFRQNRAILASSCWRSTIFQAIRKLEKHNPSLSIEIVDTDSAFSITSARSNNSKALIDRSRFPYDFDFVRIMITDKAIFYGIDVFV